MTTGVATGFTLTSADFSIRQGGSAGNGGTVIAGGIGLPATLTPTGHPAPSGFVENTVEISGLDIHLDPGTYFLNVTPVGAGFGSSFESTTSGANAVGMPPGNNGNSFLNSNSPLLPPANFAPTSVYFVGPGPFDFSEGVRGAVSVPEPGTAWLIGAGLLGLLGYTRLRLRWWSLTR